GCTIPSCTDNLSFVLAFAPRFVVIRTTPFAACAPYMEAEAASFKTSMEAMSLGLMEAKAFWEPCPDRPTEATCTPSTIYKGSVPAFMEPTPLICTLSLPPGCPELEVTCTPATLPCMARSKDWMGRSSNISPFTEAMAPVTSLRVWSPYAVITYSVSEVISGSITTSMEDQIGRAHV